MLSFLTITGKRLFVAHVRRHSAGASGITIIQEKTMKQRVFGAVLAAAAVTAGVFLSACSLFRGTTDSILDDSEDAIASNRTASKIDTAEFTYEFGDGGTASTCWTMHVRPCSA